MSLDLNSNHLLMSYTYSYNYADDSTLLKVISQLEYICMYVPVTTEIDADLCSIVDWEKRWN